MLDGLDSAFVFFLEIAFVRFEAPGLFARAAAAPAASASCPPGAKTAEAAAVAYASSAAKHVRAMSFLFRALRIVPVALADVSGAKVPMRPGTAAATAAAAGAIDALRGVLVEDDVLRGDMTSVSSVPAWGVVAFSGGSFKAASENCLSTARDRTANTEHGMKTVSKTRSYDVEPHRALALAVRTAVCTVLQSGCTKDSIGGGGPIFRG